MQAIASHETGIRLAELMAALSIATDLGIGQPMEFALRACVLALRLGEKLGLTDNELREVYYQALLRYIGCNAETHLAVALAGDELKLRAEFAKIDAGNPAHFAGLLFRMVREANAGASPLHVAGAILQGLLVVPQIAPSLVEHCEVAQRLAQRFGFDGNIVAALGQLYERWDGKGMPNKLKGEAVARSVRIVTLAQDAVIFQRMGGVEAAVHVARERKGGAYEPLLADLFCSHASQLLAGLDNEPSWENVLMLEPGERIVLVGEQFDVACAAMADFVDIKSPYTLGHSHGVAELAAGAARRFGLPETEVVTIRRAGWLHDLGRTGISSAIWDKAGPLSNREWEKVRLHTYYTECILKRPQSLMQIGAIAAMHHERLDGSGYHRGLPANMLPPAVRVLAAANVYRALIESRPHRPAYSADAAAALLQQEASAGRLDADAVNCVLEEAGHPVKMARRAAVAGLTEREIQVLRLLARGHTNKAIAAQLTVSAKTVDNHIQHIYEKLHVSTRAGATLFAIEQNLLADVG
jgi:HD-GYP domain-containing protein (c-di-GMP phosphodiesterase class II)